jgi:hypothetical protein
MWSFKLKHLELQVAVKLNNVTVRPVVLWSIAVGTKGCLPSVCVGCQQLTAKLLLALLFGENQEK